MLRLIAVMGMGTGALAVIGGTMMLIGPYIFVTLSDFTHRVLDHLIAVGGQ